MLDGTGWFIARVLMSIIILLGIALVIVSVMEVDEPIINYEIIFVDDMPCIVMASGISCDWSKWQGE